MTSIISWNVNGLRAIWKKGFADIAADMDADIICLQEIKVKEEQLTGGIGDLPGYERFLFSAERPGYSGVAVYSRIKPMRVSSGLSIPRFDAEGRSLLLEFDQFCLFAAYFPNGGASEERLEYKLDFYDAVLQYAQKEKKPLLICGDINTAHKEIDLARPRDNAGVSGFLPVERQWIDKLIAAGFYDTFRLFCEDGEHYTWWSMQTRARGRNIGWRIDYFFANQTMLPYVKKAWIWPEILGSDHCPVGIEISI